MSTQITVLGLGQIGTSIGLALAPHKSQVTRIGNDRDLSVARRAERMGAFDRIVVNLHSAAENADILILAMPTDEIEETLKVIANDLKPGAVVIDTSPVKVPVIEMAARMLGRDRYFVTMSPSLNPAYLDETASGPEAAHDDLFKNGVMVITTPPGTHGGAVDLVTDLISLLGAAPFFADPLEADGLLAASSTLPWLLAAALTHTAVDQPGWREGRKLAGKAFAQGTAPVLTLEGSKSFGKAALLNRENVLRMLDTLIASLQDERGMIDRQDEEALHEYLSEAQESRATWLKQRESANWEAQPTQSAPSMGELLGHLVGIRPKKEKDKK